MKLGIFGSVHDAQCQAVQNIAEQKGVEVLLIDSQGINQGHDASFDGSEFYYQGKSTADVGCWYLRYIMSCLPPVFEASDKFYLFSDWFTEYMHRREKQGFQLATLLSLGFQGVPVVNSPEHASVVQLKAFQLQAAKSLGLTCPKTLITNSVDRARNFIKDAGTTVCKPSMGGGLCKEIGDEELSTLDRIVKAPVIFQKKVQGISIRLTIIGDELVSAVSIPTLATDYRNDPRYIAGEQVYEEVTIPKSLVEQSIALMRSCGLVFSGLDFIRQDDGSFVFLEANSSPIYLDIEQKTEAPITRKLVEYMLFLANEPDWYRATLNQASRTKSFLQYAYPFNPHRMTE